MEYQYDEKQLRIRQQFYDDRGKWKWNDTWATILALNPDIMSAYSSMSSVPHKKGRLSLKVKELIYVAIDKDVYKRQLHHRPVRGWTGDAGLRVPVCGHSRRKAGNESG